MVCIKKEFSFEELYEMYEIYKSSFELNISYECFVDDLDNYEYILMKEGGRITGFLRYKEMDKNCEYNYFDIDNAVFLDAICVYPKQRGKGTELMKTFLSLENIKDKTIILIPFNDKSEKFYERFGFVTHNIQNLSFPSKISVLNLRKD